MDSAGPGIQVLDLATGSGNAALIAAQIGAVVTAVDFEPVLIELAEQRALSAGVDIHWLLGDLEDLPVSDSSADVVLSVFGVMYAADHAAAARELDRVTAPGGRVVLASWQPGGFIPATGARSSAIFFLHHRQAVACPAAGEIPKLCGAFFKRPTCGSWTRSLST